MTDKTTCASEELPAAFVAMMMNGDGSSRLAGVPDIVHVRGSTAAQFGREFGVFVRQFEIAEPLFLNNEGETEKNVPTLAMPGVANPRAGGAATTERDTTVSKDLPTSFVATIVKFVVPSTASGVPDIIHVLGSTSAQDGSVAVPALTPH